MARVSAHAAPVFGQGGAEGVGSAILIATPLVLLVLVQISTGPMGFFS